MPKIQLTQFKKQDLLITYEKSTQDKKRISGHLYEALDYYCFFKQHNKKVQILIQDDLTQEILIEVINDKYKKGWNYFKGDIFIGEPSTYYCKKILHCSGLSKTDTSNYIGELFSFRCSLNPINKDTKECMYLMDYRIYSTMDIISTNYVKKLNISEYRYPCGPRVPKELIYLNTKIRELNNEEFPGSFIIGNNYNIAPIKDLFLQFNRYLYTKTTGTSDCSNRLLVECKYFGIEYSFSQDITELYLEKDIGLRMRLLDLTSSEWENKLILNQTDDILEIIFKNQ